MRLPRRRFIGGGTALLGAAASAMRARPAAAVSQAPVLFVHGDGDTAALWMPTIWRFESNIYPRDRLFAVDMRLPSARRVDAEREPGRSSTAEATAQVAQEVGRVLRATRVDQLILVGHGRGGNIVRNYLATGGAAQAKLAILCGAPSHGLIVSTEHLVGSEYNGASAFLRRLNALPDEVVAGVPFVTQASDRLDKYAQPDGRYIGLPGVPTGVGYDGPALRGATNLVLQGADHRETAYSPEAFTAMHRIITGELPQVDRVRPEVRPVLNGKVSGHMAGAPTNLPIAGARVRIHRVDAVTGRRQGAQLHAQTTGRDGTWGPFDGDSEAHYEFEVSARGYPTTHIYRSPFARSSEHVHLRPHLAIPSDPTAGSLVVLSRPRGYIGFGRDILQVDGRRMEGAAGVPQISVFHLALPQQPQRSMETIFNSQRLAAMTWPLAERRVTLIEFPQ